MLRLWRRRKAFCSGIGLAGAAAAVLFGLSPVWAAERRSPATPQDLREVERKIERSQGREQDLQRQAEVLGSEVEDLRKDQVKAARAVQNAEETLSALESRGTALEAQEAALSRQLKRHEIKTKSVLSGLVRLARRPPEAMLAHPGSPHDAIRGAILMRAVLPELKTRIEALRRDVETLAGVRADIVAQRGETAAAVSRLDKKKKELAALLAQKEKRLAVTERERKAAAQESRKLAENAENLRDLLARLEQERLEREREAKRRAAQTKTKTAAGYEKDATAGIGGPEGQVFPPARGPVLIRYGEAIEDVPGGGSAKGITLQTRPEAQVVAPTSGRVVFSGLFRSYGQLLILEHSGGYHILLSGLARLDAAVGQTVVSGEPVGVMGVSGDQKLYMELRRNGQPVNPLPWLSSHKGQVSGDHDA